MIETGKRTKPKITRSDRNISVDVEPWCKATLNQCAKNSTPPQTLTTLVRTVLTMCAEHGLVIRNNPTAEFLGSKN